MSSNMGLATMTSQGSSCNDSAKTEILLPPVGIEPYVISDENKFGSFGCTMAVLSTTDLIDLVENRRKEKRERERNDGSYMLWRKGEMIGQ